MNIARRTDISVKLRPTARDAFFLNALSPSRCFDASQYNTLDIYKTSPETSFTVSIEFFAEDCNASDGELVFNAIIGMFSVRVSEFEAMRPMKPFSSQLLKSITINTKYDATLVMQYDITSMRFSEVNEWQVMALKRFEKLKESSKIKHTVEATCQNRKNPDDYQSTRIAKPKETDGKSHNPKQWSAIVNRLNDMLASSNAKQSSVKEKASHQVTYLVRDSKVGVSHSNSSLEDRSNAEHLLRIERPPHVSPAPQRIANREIFEAGPSNEIQFNEFNPEAYKIIKIAPLSDLSKARG